MDPYAPEGDCTLSHGTSLLDFAGILLVLVATVLTVQLDGPALLRVPLAVAVVFVAPGYLLGIALVPRGPSSLGAGEDRSGADGISVLDRAVLAVGLSLGIVVLLGVAVDLSPVAITTDSLLLGTVGVTGAMVPVAFYRRRQQPVADRFAPFGPSVRTAVDRRPTAGLSVTAIVLVASLLFAGGAVAFSAESGGTGAGVTELYVVDDDGNLTAAAYPTTLAVDEPRQVSVVIGNHEGQPQSYALVGQLQQADRRNGTVAVTDRRQLFSEAIDVPAGETRTTTTSVTPQEPGEYRLTYLLYRGNPPERPSAETAYREVHLWVEVAETGSQPPTAGSDD